MKKVGLLLGIAVSLVACDKKPVAEQTVINETVDQQTEQDVQAVVTEDKQPELAETATDITYNFNGEFDWSNIPVSNADIGDFPYISLPDGMVHKSGPTSSEPASADQPYTKLWDFDKLVIFDGHNVFDAEGKRGYLYAMAEDGSLDFPQMKFDKSVDEYLKDIGAVQIYNRHIPSEVIDKLDENDSNTVYKYITGDPWNNPIRQYALNHANGKIFFQIDSDSAHGEIGIIELEGFKQTIKAPTASEIKQQLDADGKAVLHINFDTNKASLKVDGQKVVDEIGKLLSDNPDLKLSIEGHTDNTGNAEHNQKLSTDRANTVMYALASKGIDIARLQAQGFGDAKPMVANDTEENKAKNRRVELVKID